MIDAAFLEAVVTAIVHDVVMLPVAVAVVQAFAVAGVFDWAGITRPTWRQAMVVALVVIAMK